MNSGAHPPVWGVLVPLGVGVPAARSGRASIVEPHQGGARTDDILGGRMSTIAWRRAWPDLVGEYLMGTRRDNGQLTFGLSGVVVRAVTALGVAGAALAAALVLQGPAAGGHSDAALGTRVA